MTQPRHRSDDERGESRHGGPSATNGSGVGGQASRQVVATQLKCLFAELTSGPMPAHLLDLVDQLEASSDSDESAPDPKPPTPPR